MNTIEDLRSCLDLVGKDLCEAHAADRMRCMTRHRFLEFKQQPEALFGFVFIEHALALRMMLAVHRTLQGKSGDKASFARLLSLARTAAPDINLSGISERLSEMRKGEAARNLQRCRNGFMAHTLMGELGSRGGIMSDPVEDLLLNLTDLYAEIRRGISAAKSWAESEDVWECREKWHARAQKTCDALFGVEDADQVPVPLEGEIGAPSGQIALGQRTGAQPL